MGKHVTACPRCGAGNIRVARLRTIADRARALIGIYPCRCRQCGARFSAELWTLAALRYARCPNCLRTDLGEWSELYFHPGWKNRLKLRLGAKPYRCEFCRYNFASFRLLRERFSWHKRRAQSSGGQTGMLPKD